MHMQSEQQMKADKRGGMSPVTPDEAPQKKKQQRGDSESL